MQSFGSRMCGCRKGAWQLFVFKTLLNWGVENHRFAISSELMLKERLLLLARPLIRLSSSRSLMMWLSPSLNDKEMPMLLSCWAR